MLKLGRLWAVLADVGYIDESKWSKCLSAGGELTESTKYVLEH